MSSESFSWPKQGIKAFASGVDGKSFHTKSIFRSFPQHAEAFKTAAEMIIDSHQSATRGPYRDSLLFPVAYLYRHCLEVKLKDLIWVGILRDFFERGKVQEILSDHNIAKLWTQVKKLLEDRWPDADPGPLKGVEAVINQFHQADPSGQVFRYEHGKDLKQHRHENLPDFISLANLRDAMNAVFNLLDASESVMRDEMTSWEGPLRRERFGLTQFGRSPSGILYAVI